MNQVLIVDDSKLSRESIENQLMRTGRYNIYASIENAANAEIVCLRSKIDLILMDVCTADNESGLLAAAKIKQYHPNIKIIVMTSMPEYSFIQKARNCSCEGFWYKEYGDTSLLDVCERVMNGEMVFPQNTPKIPIGATDSHNFTDREFEIIRELVMGKTYEEIGVDMNISINTVKYHIKNILQKTGFQNTLKLVAEVVEQRVILPKY